MTRYISIKDIQNLEVSSPELKKKMLDSMMEKRSYSHIVKEKNQKKLHAILNWREENKKGIAK